MSFGRVFDIFASIVTVALAFVLVSNANTANIITAFGNAFSGSVKAAVGH
jgi:hypothetical protein